jgi:predicted porin
MVPAVTDKSLAMLAGLLLASGAATAGADVSLFAPGAEGLASADPQGAGANQASGCDECLFGFEGREELGNGLKAVYRMDWQYQGGTGGTTPAGQDRWLGLSGDFGEVKVGTLSSRYKSQGALPDPVYDALLPFHDNDPQSSPADHDRNEGVGLSYENAGILVFADYIGSNSENNDPAYNIGARYTMDNLTVFGQYRIDNSLANDVESQNPDSSTDAWFLGGGLTLGNNSIYAGYGKGEQGVNTGALSGYNAWQVVGVHALGRSTSVFAGYSGAGCIDKNPDACTKGGTDGVADDKFSLGIRHKF